MPVLIAAGNFEVFIIVYVFMRFITLFFAVVVTTLAPVICKGQGANTNGQGSKAVKRSARTVVFPRGGISFEVGAGWKRVDSKLAAPICPPTLVGAYGMLRTMLFAPAISNVMDAVKTMRRGFDRNSLGVKDSFQQSNFTTSGGLSVCHVAYSYLEGPPGGPRKTYQVHNYIIQRRDGRVVTANYTCLSKDFSPAVTQLIERSLKLQ